MIIQLIPINKWKCDNNPTIIQALIKIILPYLKAYIEEYLEDEYTGLAQE